MATRTAKGIANSKASGNTLALPNISLQAGAALIVGLGYDDAQGHPTEVKWGNRLLRRRIARDPAGIDIAGSLWTVAFVKNTETKDITASWSGNIVERAMFVTQLEGKNRIDVRSGNNDGTATTSPTTGATGVQGKADNFALCMFVSEGPDTNDTPGTAEIMNGGSPNFDAASLGQRAGTNGAPPASNVTIQETYLQLTSSDPTEGRLVGATSREWTSMLLSFTDIRADLSIGFSDRSAVEQLLDQTSPLVSTANLVFHFNDDIGRWEAYDVSNLGTLIAVYGPNTDWWEIV